MPQEEIVQQIEKYLLGKMTAEEKGHFEQEVAMDDFLRQELEKHRKAHMLIQYLANQDLKSRLHEISDPASVKKARSIPLYSKLAVAASFLVVLALGIRFWAVSQYSDPALAKQALEKTDYTLKGQSDMAAESTEVRFKKAENAFFQEDYESAAAIYREMIGSNPLMRPKAEWNLLMCALADPAIPEDPRKLLQSILTNPQHPYHNQARDLQARRNSWVRTFFVQE